jgi:hypothetical protein
MDQALQKEPIHILRDMRNFMKSQNRRLEKPESFAHPNAEDNVSPSHEIRENKQDERLREDEFMLSDSRR